jgi:hypothetical protein
MHESEQLALIDELHGALGRMGVRYWLFGGWAVDFHVGRITREHSDIDIAVWLPDLGKAREALYGCGWSPLRESEANGFAEFERGSIRLDLTWIERVPTTGSVVTPLAEGSGAWPDGSFEDDVAELAGIRAHVVSLASLITDKSDSSIEASSAWKDRADVSVLTRLRGGG